MKKMLDEEMPQSAASRRAMASMLLLWIFFSCVVTSVFWFWAFRSDMFRSLLIPQPETAAAAPITAPQSVSLVHSENRTETPVWAGTDISKKSGSTAKPSRIAAYPAPLPVATAGSESLMNRLPELRPLTQEHNTQSADFQYKSGIQTPNLSSETQLAAAPAPIRPIPVPMSAVARDQSTTVACPAAVEIASVAEIIKPNPVRTLTFGPTVGLSSEEFRALNGATVGATVNWHFSRHWGVRSAFLYSYLRPSPSTRPVASLRAREYADATGNYAMLDSYGHLLDPETGLPTVANKVYVPLQRLNRFEIPMMVYAQIFKRVRLMAGPTMSYSLSVQADKVYALDRVVSNAANDRSAEKIDELASGEIKPWQLGFQSGIGVRLGDRFEMDFNYRINSIRTYSRVIYDYDGSLLEYAPQRAGQINNLTIFTLNGIMFF